MPRQQNLISVNVGKKLKGMTNLFGDKMNFYITRRKQNSVLLSEQVSEDQWVNSHLAFSASSTSATYFVQSKLFSVESHRGGFIKRPVINLILSEKVKICLQSRFWCKLDYASEFKLNEGLVRFRINIQYFKVKILVLTSQF